jgi:LiaI-LiaF-like transmembrane region
MNCAYHADIANTAFCIKCGKPLCAECVRQVQSSIYCENCLAEGLASGSAPRTTQAAQMIGGSSPETAFLLGLIPGVGAIYNAQYFKAALHLLIFGTLVTLADSSGPAETLFGLLAFGFYVYMPFEAFYTAKKRKLAREGINLITPFDQLNEQFGQIENSELWGGIALVVIGGLFLLDNFRIISMAQVGKLWPALLILAGVFLIHRFQKGKNS